MKKSNSINNLEIEHEIKINKIPDINSSSFMDEIVRSKIDLVISIASPKIFSKRLLGINEIKFINLHSSLLPDYKGRQPLFWALLNSEKKAGVTAHIMSEKLDEGNILMQKSFIINEYDTLHTLYQKVISIGPIVLRIATDLVRIKNYRGISQRSSNSKTYFLPTKVDRLKFAQLGKKFL